MPKYHKKLTQEHWNTFSFDEQVGNAGVEIGRNITWRQEGNYDPESAYLRGMELLDLTILDPKNSNHIKELMILKRNLKTWHAKPNEESDRHWNSYFLGFMLKARITK